MKHLWRDRDRILKFILRLRFDLLLGRFLRDNRQHINISHVQAHHYDRH